MRDRLIRSPDTRYFPTNDFDVLQKSPDRELVHVAEVVRRFLPSVESKLKEYGLSEQGSDGLCLIAASSLNDRLKDAGLDSKILQGDLVVAPNQTVEHAVNWIRTKNSWMIIDLTVSQIPGHENQQILVRTTEPDLAALKVILKNEYNWWFPEDKKEM